MIFSPEKYNSPVVDINLELLKLEGELPDKEAKLSLIKFLRANIGFTVELLFDIRLSPYQEITLKAMMKRNFSMCVWSRGAAKSTIAAIFCILQCIFEPETKIIIAGPTFRTARNIFDNIEKMVNNPKARLLAQCFGIKPSKRNDVFTWNINGGSIVAIPLNGEKIRGFRANILVLDEFFLLSKQIVNEVLVPFLSANKDVGKRIKKADLEEELKKKGIILDKIEQAFDEDTKMIALSSASYTFQYLYELYKTWESKIYDENLKFPKYFISQISYEVVPKEIMNKTLIDEAKSGGTSDASFLREYCARFTDGSDGYFSAKKMEECTVKDGDEPCLQVVGQKGKTYVIGIDPSFDNSPSSDNFAMNILELDFESKSCILIHNYAVAGGDLKDHISYFYYLYTCFSPSMVIMDTTNGGTQFIDSCNQSELFIKADINLKFLDFDTDKDSEDHVKMLKEGRNQYNKTTGSICVRQFFTSEFIKKANEYLQACVDHKKIWFASKITPFDLFFKRTINQEALIPREVLGYTRGDEMMTELIDTQDRLIFQTKKECALIELKATAKGTQSFDLPSNLKRSTAPNKARKDSYTALLLANWVAKCYFEMFSLKEEEPETGFTPFIIR